MAELEIKPSPRMRLRVAAVGAAAVFLALVLTYLLLGGTGDFFARRANLTTYMPDAAGLAKDGQVRMNGIRIGKVVNVEFAGGDNRRPVRAELRVLARYLKNIPEDSRTAVSADTMVAPKFLDIKQGQSIIPIREDGVMRSEPVQAATERANQIASLERQLAQVDQILADLSNPSLPASQLFMSEEIYDTTLKGMQDFEKGVHTFITPQSDLGKAFYTLELYNAMEDLFRQTDRALIAIQNGEGTFGHMFASDQQYSDLLRELGDLRSDLADANAGKGQLGEWLQDDAHYRQFSRLLASMDRTFAEWNTGEGRAGQLIANAQLYESITGSLRRLENVLRTFREDPRKYLRVKPFEKNPMSPRHLASARPSGQANSRSSSVLNGTALR